MEMKGVYPFKDGFDTGNFSFHQIRTLRKPQKRKPGLKAGDCFDTALNMRPYPVPAWRKLT